MQEKNRSFLLDHFDPYIKEENLKVEVEVWHDCEFGLSPVTQCWCLGYDNKIFSIDRSPWCSHVSAVMLP